jgi:hypothetical protein
MVLYLSRKITQYVPEFSGNSMEADSGSLLLMREEPSGALKLDGLLPKIYNTAVRKADGDGFLGTL